MTPPKRRPVRKRVTCGRPTGVILLGGVASQPRSRLSPAATRPSRSHRSVGRFCGGWLSDRAFESSAELHQLQTLLDSSLAGSTNHFLNGRWIVGTHPQAAKARHLAARPAISATYLRGEQLGIFTHGHATPLNPRDRPDDPTWPNVRGYLVDRCARSALPRAPAHGQPPRGAGRRDDRARPGELIARGSHADLRARTRRRPSPTDVPR